MMENEESKSNFEDAQHQDTQRLSSGAANDLILPDVFAEKREQAAEQKKKSSAEDSGALFKTHGMPKKFAIWAAWFAFCFLPFRLDSDAFQFVRTCLAFVTPSLFCLWLVCSIGRVSVRKWVSLAFVCVLLLSAMRLALSLGEFGNLAVPATAGKHHLVQRMFWRVNNGIKYRTELWEVHPIFPGIHWRKLLYNGRNFAFGKSGDDFIEIVTDPHDGPQQVLRFKL